MLFKHILVLILNRLNYKELKNILLFLILTKKIDASTNNIWRILFFKKMNLPIGSWFNACKSITNLGDTYNIRCYQCGIQIVRLLYRPVKCPKCNMGLCFKDTWISTYL